MIQFITDLMGPVYHVIYINATTADVNLFTLAGSPATGHFEFRIASGVVVGASTQSTFAIRTGAMPGLTRIVNRGTIIGKGGHGSAGQAIGDPKFPDNGGGGGGGAGYGPAFAAGGVAGANAQPGSSGALLTGGAGGAGGVWDGVSGPTSDDFDVNGGTAIFLDVNISIDNSQGLIYGGGGGGGGGIFGAGSHGNAGGTGGAAGVVGNMGLNGLGQPSGIVGGDAGASINRNGHTCTFIGSQGTVLPAVT